MAHFNYGITRDRIHLWNLDSETDHAFGCVGRDLQIALGVVRDFVCGLTSAVLGHQTRTSSPRVGFSYEHIDESAEGTCKSGTTVRLVSPTNNRPKFYAQSIVIKHWSIAREWKRSEPVAR